jgi:hypothetical protein
MEENMIPHNSLPEPVRNNGTPNSLPEYQDPKMLTVASNLSQKKNEI